MDVSVLWWDLMLCSAHERFLSTSKSDHKNTYEIKIILLFRMHSNYFEIFPTTGICLPSIASPRAYVTDRYWNDWNCFALIFCFVRVCSLFSSRWSCFFICYRLFLPVNDENAAGCYRWWWCLGLVGSLFREIAIILQLNDFISLNVHV